MAKTASERFMCKVVKKENGCWEWTATKDGCGYGVFMFKGKNQRAHRVSWELNKGQIPEGLNCLHRCDNPPCVNPDHLWLGTQLENVRDMLAKGRKNAARGIRNGSITCPQSRPRGDAHYSRTKPELLAAGDRNGSRTRPESRPKGSAHWKSVLGEKEVREMRTLYQSGVVSYSDLAQNYGVGKSAIAKIITRQLWKHVV